MADEDKNKFHEFDAEVFASGTWNGNDYTDKDLDEICRNFEALKDSVKPPIKLGHNEQQMRDIMKDGQPALGWVKGLRKVGSKLVATLTQVPDVVFKAIKAGLYKRVSSEIFMKYRKGGKDLGKVFSGVALLGADIPAVDTLKDLEAYLTQSMHDDASFEKVAVYSFAADESGTKIIDRKESNMDEKEKQIYTDRIAALEAENAQLKPGAEDAKKFKAELDAFRKTQSEERKTSQQTALKTFCEDMVKAGKLPPASRDILLAFEKHNFSEDSGYSLPVGTVIEALRVFEKVILDTSEKGKEKGKESGSDGKSVFEEVGEKAKKFASDNKVDLATATSAVLKAEPELAEKYMKASTRTASSDE